MEEIIIDTLNIKFQQRFLSNLITNIVYFILNLIVGFALVPYFIDSLGYAAYGIIPLATSITSYVTLIIDALNIPVSRYISISLQRGNKAEANKTFNTVLFGTLAIILILIPIGILVSCLSPFIFNIGGSSENDVFFLFLFVIGSVLIRAWSSNFMATLFAYNRLDLRNYVNIVNTGLQIVIIVCLFNIITPSLASVGIAYFSAAFCSLLVAIYFSRKIASFLKLNPKQFSGRLFREIIHVAFWSVIDKFGCILNGTIALLAANVILGDVIAADYSIAQTIYLGLMAVAGLVTTLFTPKIYSYISSRDISGLVNFSKSAIKCSGLMIALLIALVCLFAPQILTVWMGEEYLYLVPLVWIVVIPVIMWVTVSPIGSFGIALLKVRVPALSAVFTGVLNIVLSCLFPVLLNNGVYGIAMGTIVSVFIHAWVICPIYYAYITKVSWNTYIFPMYKSIFYTIPLLFVGWILLSIISIRSIWIAILVMGIITVFYLLIFPHIILKSFERDMIRLVLPKKIAERIPRWIL